MTAGTVTIDLAARNASALGGSPEGLRAQFAEDGFLFFRGLLDSAAVLEVRRLVLNRIASVGWLRAGTDPDLALPGPVAHHAKGRRAGHPVVDSGWAEGYQAVQSLEPLHALAHHPALRGILTALLGPQLVVHPRKIARIVFPGIEFPTPVHQDWWFNRPTVDLITAWVPLGRVPGDLGGLRLLSGSAAAGPREVVPVDGQSGEGVATGPDDEGGWATTDYEEGDVVIFHGFCVHGADANRGEQLRLSADFRYQSADESVHSLALLPHHYRKGLLPGWSTLTDGWSTTRAVEVTEPIRVAAVRASSSIPASRLVPWPGARFGGGQG